MARGDVLLVTLPPSDRREQSGRRPAVAVQTDQAGEPMLMVAPVTSSLAALRFLLHRVIWLRSHHGRSTFATCRLGKLLRYRRFVGRGADRVAVCGDCPECRIDDA